MRPAPKVLGQQVAFLSHFAVLGVITEAAVAAGVDRERHYEWLADPEKYPNYREAYENAREKAADRLEAEATRRAVDGWEEPVFQQGMQVGLIRRHSDRMLEILLKARRPERFRERHDVTTGGEKLPAAVDLSRVSTETLKRLREELGEPAED